MKESPNEKSYIEYAQATKDKKNPVSYFIENGTLTLKEAGNTGASYYINVDISFYRLLSASKNIEVTQKSLLNTKLRYSLSSKR